MMLSERYIFRPLVVFWGNERNRKINILIIGNGFDLDHGLDTRYSALQKILKRRDISKYEMATDFFLCGNETLWSKVEQHLGDYNFDDFRNAADENIQEISNMGAYDYSSDSGDLAISVDNAAYELEKYSSSDGVLQNIVDLEQVEELFCFVIRGLSEMVDLVDQKLTNVPPIYLNLVSLHDSFLNFNYTHTLETVYGVLPEHVFHIHGVTDESIIFGTDKIDELENITESNVEDYYDDNSNSEPDIDSSFYGEAKPSAFQGCITTANEYACQFNKIMKDTLTKEMQHQQLKDWCNKQKNVHKITITGHAFGTVDLPYFQELIQMLNPDEIEISYFNEDDKKRIEKFFNNQYVGTNIIIKSLQMLKS